MTAEPTLVIGWLLVAHLAADFVLQTDHMAIGKFGDGPEAWRALGAHAAVVGLVNLPAVLVFGVSGLLFVVLTVLSHGAIDRAKIVLTRRVEPRGAAGEEPSADDVAAGPALDRAWTPVPGLLFAMDQFAHIGVLVAAWAVLLSGAVPLQGFTEAISTLPGTADGAGFHRNVLSGVVLASLLIVNIRAASLFVATLVRPPNMRGDAGHAPQARIGAVIGVLERLLIAALVLGGAVATIGLVVAAKTLARFKQLDDREFAEYYLLGTLASVTIAVATSLLAAAVLARP
jgi:hypothetical protein